MRFEAVMPSEWGATELTIEGPIPSGEFWAGRDMGGCFRIEVNGGEDDTGVIFLTPEQFAALVNCLCLKSF